jgi:steroid delta-isomerase-like uncharacterized protein
MDILEVGKEQMEAAAAGDWERYKRCLADDVKYEEVATRSAVTGKDQYLSFAKKWWTGFPNLRSEVHRVFVSGDTLISEIEWIGTHTGPFAGPFGTIPPTHRRIALRAVVVSRYVDGKVAETHHYFDMLTALAQIGALPGVGAGAAQRRAAETRPPVP